jgi:hypothetical protein
MPNNKDFDKLAINGHNYPTWASEIEINFASRGIVEAIKACCWGFPYSGQEVFCPFSPEALHP